MMIVCGNTNKLIRITNVEQAVSNPSISDLLLYIMAMATKYFSRDSARSLDMFENGEFHSISLCNIQRNGFKSRIL